MTPENDVQAYRERRAEEFFADPSKGGIANLAAYIRKAHGEGFDAGRDLGEVQGMVKALEIVLSANPDSPFLQTTVTEMRKALRELLKSGEK